MRHVSQGVFTTLGLTRTTREGSTAILGLLMNSFQSQVYFACAKAGLYSQPDLKGLLMSAGAKPTLHQLLVFWTVSVRCCQTLGPLTSDIACFIHCWCTKLLLLFQHMRSLLAAQLFW
ncbi:hypothetical protein WJX82_003678 [Trebouxia sp. C0006]